MGKEKAAPAPEENAFVPFVEQIHAEQRALPLDDLTPTQPRTSIEDAIERVTARDRDIYQALKDL